jgi:hypothetical protein
VEAKMASEWVKLYDTEADASIYVNLAQASSIYPEESGGSVIWFFEFPDEENIARIFVKESPDEIFRILRETPRP